MSDALADVSVVSAVNWAELLSKFADAGEYPDTVAERLESDGMSSIGLDVISVTAMNATTIGRLRPMTRITGLSLGNRAWLALALRLGYGVLTADRQWTNLDFSLEIKLIR